LIQGNIFSFLAFDTCGWCSAHCSLTNIGPDQENQYWPRPWSSPCSEQLWLLEYIFHPCASYLVVTSLYLSVRWSDTPTDKCYWNMAMVSVWSRRPFKSNIKVGVLIGADFLDDVMMGYITWPQNPYSCSLWKRHKKSRLKETSSWCSHLSKTQQKIPHC
jgi:hypothetical protein